MHKKIILLVVGISTFFFVYTQPALDLVDHPVQLRDKPAFNLKVPASYKISAAVEGLDRPRFFAKSPDGRLFITDMYSRADNKRGRVLILDKWDNTEKKFDSIITFLDGLHNPNQVAFYTFNNQHFIYIAETGRLTCYRYHFGDKSPSSPATVIATFPDYGLSYKYGGWHLTRSISFHNNKLYVSVGSSCDACIEKEEIRATVVEMDPDGSNQRIYARGLRNSVGLKWVNGKLWATSMGRDNLGPDKPEDLLLTVIQGEYYGWPFYFQFRKKILTDPAFKDSVQPAYIKRPPVAPYVFAAHSAPLGFDYFTGFDDSLLNNSFIVALHGSTSAWRQRGNAIVQMLPGGSYREIVTGFMQGNTESKRYGRPCDVFKWDAKSFFVSDDKNGIIYYIWKEK
jgi:glucose/arabinose dehydrogenase